MYAMFDLILQLIRMQIILPLLSSNDCDFLVGGSVPPKDLF
jgi:hypothetical protein